MNKPLINVVPFEGKAYAAGSDRGQQLVPALVGAFWIVFRMV